MGDQFCDLCGDDVHALSSRGWCDGCEAWDDYWNSLTPEQKADEIRSMDEYAAEEGF